MKNRTVIGIICIILAVATVFVVSPVVNKMSEGKTEVVRFAKDISQGTQITDADIETVKIAKSAIPDNAIKDKNEIIGKYANSNLYKGDIATDAKFTEDANTDDNVLSSLSDGKVAMSITIDSFAGGLSGKLKNGDVVSIYITDKDGNTEVPAELKYVRVITTTTAGGVDNNDVEPNEDGTFDLPTTVTVLVSVRQAQVLANNEKSSTMHIALVCRADDKQADKYITKQDKTLKELAEAETNE